MTWNRIHFEPETRWCSSCQQSPNVKGGEYIPFNNGRNRRWICVDCKEKRDERNKDRAAEAG